MKFLLIVIDSENKISSAEMADSPDGVRRAFELMDSYGYVSSKKKYMMTDSTGLPNDHVDLNRLNRLYTQDKLKLRPIPQEAVV